MGNEPIKGNRLKRKIRAKYHEIKFKITKWSWWKKKIPSMLASLAKGMATRKNKDGM